MTKFESEVRRTVAEFAARLASLSRKSGREPRAGALKPSRQQIDVARVMTDGLRRTVKAYEAACVVGVLEHCKGNVSRTARALRISRTSLQRKLRRLKLR